MSEKETIGISSRITIFISIRADNASVPKTDTQCPMHEQRVRLLMSSPCCQTATLSNIFHTPGTKINTIYGPVDGQLIVAGLGI